MGDVHTLTPRPSAPQTAAAVAGPDPSGPASYPALTVPQARTDLVFGLKASRDMLDSLIARVEAECPASEVLSRVKVLDQTLAATGRVVAALHQLGDTPGAA